MSEGNQPGSQDAVGRYFASGSDNVKLIYVLYLLSVLVGITVLIGLVMAYLNRGEAEGTWAESHYTYQIRTFWIGLLYSVISTVLVVIGIGFLLYIAVAIWAIVRCVRGLQWSAAGQPVPDPQTWVV
jgi:uncharacterized membrane protein